MPKLVRFKNALNLQGGKSTGQQAELSHFCTWFVVSSSCSCAVPDKALTLFSRHFSCQRPKGRKACRSRCRTRRQFYRRRRRRPLSADRSDGRNWRLRAGLFGPVRY